VQKVWIIHEGVAKQQTVRTGREKDGRVEILAGLAAGTLIVQFAEEGHDGPVVALEKSWDEVTRAELSENSTAARLVPSASGSQ
jgi:hypothetical protein